MTNRPETDTRASADGQGWFDRTSNVRKLLWVLYGACAASIVLEVALRVGHVGHFEKMTGLYAVAGLAGGVVLVLVAREILARLLRRPEEYYDD